MKEKWTQIMYRLDTERDLYNPVKNHWSLSHTARAIKTGEMYLGLATNQLIDIYF